MEQFIGCDARRPRISCLSIDERGAYGRSIRAGHDREVFGKFLRETAGRIADRVGNQRQLLLDGRRNGAGGTPAAAGACSNGQTTDAGPAQDQARRMPADWPCCSAMEPCRTFGFPRPH
jgi:hypothetical protein